MLSVSIQSDDSIHLMKIQPNQLTNFNSRSMTVGNIQIEAFGLFPSTLEPNM